MDSAASNMFRSRIVAVFPLLISLSSCATMQHLDDDWYRFSLPRRTPLPFKTQSPRYKWDDDDVPSHKSFRFDPILIMLIVVPLVIGIVIIICKCLISEYSEESRSSATGPTVHLPPRSSTVPPRSTNINLTHDASAAYSVYRESLFTATSFRSTSANNTNVPIVPSSDRPPDYSAVVLDDLTEKMKFPEVKPSNKQDTPPPKYDEHLPKF